MTICGAQEPQVRITRARAAKANAAVLRAKQPPFIPAGQKKTNRGATKRAAADESNMSVPNTVGVQPKRRAVLRDLSNCVKESAAVDDSRPKAKVAAQTIRSKGRVRGASQGCKNDAKAGQIKKEAIPIPQAAHIKQGALPASLHVQTVPCSNVVCDKENLGQIKKEAIPDTQAAQIKKEALPAPLHVQTVPCSNVICDKENLDQNHLQEISENKPKDFNPVIEQVLLRNQCQQSRVKINEIIAVSVNDDAITCLEQQTLGNLSISGERKSILKQAGKPCHEKVTEGLGWSSSLEFIDIDTDHKDSQMCSTYVADIYEHLHMAELKRRPLPNLMDTVQVDINANMRGILIDWLVEVSEEYRLVPDTLYSAVSYIDRFLSANVVNRQKLQLLGITCMLISSKYEEICAPRVEEFCYITDNTYTRDEVLAMETQVLNCLHFELTTPTTKSFLRRFIRAAQAAYKTPTLHLEFMGNYLAELTLMEYDFLQYLPSLIAASAVFVAKVTMDPGTHPWNSTLQHYTGYKPSDLRDCACAIHDLQLNKKGCTLTAIREKYRQHKFKCVASLSPPPVISPQLFNDTEK